MSFACRFNAGSSAGASSGTGSTGSGMTVTVAPTSASSVNISTSSVVMGPFVVTVVGGSGTYTYQWAVVYQTEGCDVNFSAPTAASTTIQLTNVLGRSTVVNASVTVTDGSGTMVTQSVTVSHRNTGVLL